MDVKNSPAGHVTEKCAIRQMSFSTDDDNEYDELAHLFTPQNKQNLPASSGDEMKLKTAATKRLTKAKAGYRRLSTPILPGETYNEVFGTNDPVKTPEPKSSEARSF